MNILLVYPEFPDTFWSFKHALKFVRKKAGSPPLGLLTVAAMLPQAWDKRLVDVNVTELKDTDLMWADYVFISAMVVQRASTRDVVARCKSMGVPVVAGGPLFTIEPDSFPEVDHLVLNEGEITLPQFLDDLARGALQRVYTTTEYPDIRNTPVPMWELADLSRYDTFLREYQPPRVRVHLDKNDIAAFFHSIYALGMKGIERASYWRLFFWALFKKPRVFPLAITLAVYGYHFRTVAEMRAQG